MTRVFVNTQVLSLLSRLFLKGSVSAELKHKQTTISVTTQAIIKISKTMALIIYITKKKHLTTKFHCTRLTFR